MPTRNAIPRPRLAAATVDESGSTSGNVRSGGSGYVRVMLSAAAAVRGRSSGRFARSV